MKHEDAIGRLEQAMFNAKCAAEDNRLREEDYRKLAENYERQAKELGAAIDWLRTDP